MAEERILKTKVELAGESEYTAALKEINSAAKLTNSELSALKAEYDGQLNSLTYLKQKTDLLGDAYGKAKDKLKVVSDALENAKANQSKYGEDIDRTKTAIVELSEKMSNLDTSTEEGAAAYQAAQKEMEALNGELEDSQKYYAAASSSVQKWKIEQNNAYSSQRKLGEQLGVTKAQLASAEQSADGFATTIDGFGKKVKAAAEGAEGFEQAADGVADGSKTAAKAVGEAASGASDAGNAFKAGAEAGKDLGDGMRGAGDDAKDLEEGVDAASVAVGALAADAISGLIDKVGELSEALIGAGIEYQEAQKQLQAATGATGEELAQLNEIALALFGDAYGDSLMDAYNGVITIKNATGLMGDELKKAAESAYALADTFEFDLQESARAVDALIKNFGITAEEAYDIIAVGAQNGANKNGDLLDILNEYSAQYSALGLTASQFIQSLISGADAGVFSIDKVGDAVKEFNIRSKDASTTSQEAFELLGMSAAAMTAAFAAGGDSAQAAMFQVVSALEAMEDPVAKNTAAVGLFGTMYEDLEANLLPILASMEDASDDAYGAMERINEIRYNDLTTQWDVVKRKVTATALPQLQSALTSVGKALESDQIADAAEELGESLGELAENGGELAEEILPTLVEVAGGAVEVLDVALDNLPELATALVSYKGAALAAKIVQEGLNATLGLNPWGIAAAGIAATVAAVVKICGPLDAAGNAAYQASESVFRLSQAAEEAQATYASTSASIDAEQGNVLALVAQLEQLTAASSASGGEQQQILSIVDRLNEAVPELNLAYDEQTNSVNLTTDAIIRMAKAKANEDKYAAMQEELIALMEARDGVSERLAEDQEALAEAEAAYADALAAQAANTDTSTIAQTEYADAVNNAYEEMESAREDVEQSTKKYNELNAAVDETSREMAELAGETEEAAEETEDLAEGTAALSENSEDYTEALEAMTEALEEAGVAGEGLADSLVSQGISADDAASKIEEYKDRTLDAFNRIEAEEEISVKSMIETLEYNAAVTKSWSENLATLYQSAGNSATRDFLAYMEGLGPSYASILDELVNDTSGELLGRLSTAWANGSTEAVNAALLAMGVLPDEAASIAASAAVSSGEQLSGDTAAYTDAGSAAAEAYSSGFSEVTDGVSAVIDDLQATIKRRLEEIGATAEKQGKTAGQKVTTGLKTGVAAGTPAVKTAATAAANGIWAAINSKSWYSLGYNLMAGTANGASSGAALLKAAVVKAVNAALAAGKSAADIRSPSHVWEDELGAQLFPGAARGVERTAPEFAETVGTTMTTALNAAKETMNGFTGTSTFDAIPTIGREFLAESTAAAASSPTRPGGASDAQILQYLGQIVSELKATAGVTPGRVARALSPYVDKELGATARRKERNSI